ncbi:MAG: hypothetical protein PHQ34_15670 [Methanothrix sp.]|nr:hypothetical protein [Methanothrix sp.]
MGKDEREKREEQEKQEEIEEKEQKEEKEQMIQEEDEYGTILTYPNWSKKNAPKEQQSKWEVPIYM